MTTSEVKRIFDIARNWAENAAEYRKAGYLYHHEVDFFIGGLIFTCKSSDFIDFNESYYENDEDAWEETIGYIDGKSLMLTNVEHIQAMRIYEVKEG